MQGTQYTTGTQNTWFTEVDGVYDDDLGSIAVTFYRRSNDEMNDVPPGFNITGNGLTRHGLREAAEWLLAIVDEIGATEV